MIAGALAAGAVAVTTSLSPQPAFFADPVQATAVLVVDTRRVDPDVRVAADLAPFAAAAPTRTVRRAGRVVELRLTWTTSCVAEACAPPRSVALPPLRIDGRTRDGRRFALTAAWPRARVAPRVAEAATAAATPPFRIQATPPPPSYAADPTGLALGLDVAGGALVALGLALGTRELLRRRRLVRLGRRAQLPPLAYALELLRESERRQPEDRRKALNLLARTARPDPVAAEAARLAWSQDPPSPERVESLARTVEEDGRR